MTKIRALSSLAPAAALLCLPATASAHSFGQVYTLPVPFWLYAWAAAAALVVSFVVAGIFLTGAGQTRAVGSQHESFRHELPLALLRLLQALSLLGLGLCLATGLWGTPNSYANFNMTFFWIVFVLGFTYLTALVGDLYALINPWRLLCTGIARVFPRYPAGRCAYPARAGYWPALILYGAFIWIELFGRTSPFSLALLLCAYTALNLLAVWLIGAQAWFTHGEFFSVLLRLIARLAPVEFAGDAAQPSRRFRWRPPLSGLLARAPEHYTLTLFVLFLLSATAFDGLHEARPWVSLYWTTIYRDVLSLWLGPNPLAAFSTLREIYRWWQSAWLLLSPFIYLALYLAAIEWMRRLTGRRLGLGVLAQRFLHSLLPIVLVYHITHYYTLIQTQGVRIIALASDPFGYGWNLFGTATWFRGTNVPDTTVVWHAQVALMLLGHIASVVLAHLEALRIFPDRRTATLSQLPMLALMVAFTVFGLWILSLPFGTAGPS